MDFDIVMVICGELAEAIGETEVGVTSGDEELVVSEVDAVAGGEEVVFNDVEVSSAIEMGTDRVGEYDVSASSIHVVSYVTGEVAVALPRVEDGEALTTREVSEETASTGVEGMLAEGTGKITVPIQLVDGPLGRI